MQNVMLFHTQLPAPVYPVILVILSFNAWLKPKKSNHANLHLAVPTPSAKNETVLVLVSVCRTIKAILTKVADQNAY